MSLFRKPKKIQRRVFSCTIDEDEKSDGGQGDHGDVDKNEIVVSSPPSISTGVKKMNSAKERSKKIKSDSVEKTSSKSKALLSFADEDEEMEVFQVRKSSHSKKVMRMLDKERRKKNKERGGPNTAQISSNRDNTDSFVNKINIIYGCDQSSPTELNRNNTENTHDLDLSSSNSAKCKKEIVPMSRPAKVSIRSDRRCKTSKTDSVQTEIRTDDFVLVIKESEPSRIVLNGRAALCAGRDDVSDEDMDYIDNEKTDPRHRFSNPQQLKQVLESGSIPDAAMIHEARKCRQKAREKGDFIPIEEPKEVLKKGSRLTHEDVEDENSDEAERMDMNAITGIKEREERREQFYSVENDYSEEDSDHETNEWENQQIRKGVTGAQLVNAQQETVLSRFMIKPAATNSIKYPKEPPSTSIMLEQAYAKCTLEKPRGLIVSIKSTESTSKPATLKSSKEIQESICKRLSNLRELNIKHIAEVDHRTNELNNLKLQKTNCTFKAPIIAAKYRFYQEIRCYVTDLIECLNEKVPLIDDLEKRTLQLLAKNQTFLTERRRQDVRDQAKEIAESYKPTYAVRGREYEEQQRRTAEREGRRTRRRYDREKNEMSTSHLDGMSSDDETSDRYADQFQTTLDKLLAEADAVFADVTEEYCKINLILMKFYAWRKTDIDSYKDAFVNLCIPKVIGPLVRLELIGWSPLQENYKDLEQMNWYIMCMNYAWTEIETLETLAFDPDLNLVPTIIERVVVTKVTDIVTQCWDPLSTSQTLRLIGFINRIARDYPLKDCSKPLQRLFNALLDKMKLSLENDVFIPIFPKQVQDAKTSFFQRQFCSGLKLFRNFLSWQMIIADKPLRELAISALLNRYLLLAIRVCTPTDAVSKAYIVVSTLPTVWLQPNSETLNKMKLFIEYIKSIIGTLDSQNPQNIPTLDKAKQILQKLHSL